MSSDVNPIPSKIGLITESHLESTTAALILLRNMFHLSADITRCRLQSTAVRLLSPPLLPDAAATIYPPQFRPTTYMTHCLLEPGHQHFISLPKLSPVMRRLVTTLNSICKNSLIFQPSFQGCGCCVALLRLGAVSWVSALRHFLFIVIPRCSISEHHSVPPHFHSMPRKEKISRQKARLKLGIIFPPAAPWQLSAQEWQRGIYG